MTYFNQKVIVKVALLLWKNAKIKVVKIRLWKNNYPLRRETIERAFGDCKEQHGLRFPRVRGLLKNEQNATMIFVCHNLKKMANWIWRNHPHNANILFIFSKFIKFIKITIKKVAYSF